MANQPDFALLTQSFQTISTQIGLIAKLPPINDRQESQNRHDEVMRSLQTLNNSLQGLNTRVHGLSTRVDGLTTRVNSLTTHVDGFSTRVDWGGGMGFLTSRAPAQGLTPGGLDTSFSYKAMSSNRTPRISPH